jgi:hypothetical protein
VIGETAQRFAVSVSSILLVLRLRRLIFSPRSLQRVSQLPFFVRVQGVVALQIVRAYEPLDFLHNANKRRPDKAILPKACDFIREFARSKREDFY